jgi:hypothetical protein
MELLKGFFNHFLREYICNQRQFGHFEENLKKIYICQKIKFGSDLAKKFRIRPDPGNHNNSSLPDFHVVVFRQVFSFCFP